ncbi:MAG: DUF6868 family protein [Planctomycetota bacterium]|jgi:hypothetical protein
MTLEEIRSMLMWCAIINYALLLWWFAFFVFARGFVRRFHGRWFTMSDEAFDLAHYRGLLCYKLLIFVFNLVPFVVLYIVG